MVRFNSEESIQIRDEVKALMEAESGWMYQFFLMTFVRRKKFIQEYVKKNVEIYRNKLIKDDLTSSKEEYKDFKKACQEQAAMDYDMSKGIAEDLAEYFFNELDEGQYLEILKITNSIDPSINAIVKTIVDPSETESKEKPVGSGSRWTNKEDKEKEMKALFFVTEKAQKGENPSMKQIAEHIDISDSTLHRRLAGDPPKWFNLKKFLVSSKNKNKSKFARGKKTKNGDIEAWEDYE